MDRERMHQELAAGRVLHALAELRVALDAGLTAADAQAALRSFEPLLREPPEGFVRLRLAVLSTFTVEPLLPWVRLLGLLERVVVEPYVAPFDQIEPELLRPESGLWDFAPDVIAIAADGEDMAPALYTELPAADAGDAQKAASAHALARIRGWIDAVRARSTAPVLIHDWIPPAWPLLGALDAALPGGQAALVHAANRELAVLADGTASLYPVDVAGAAARIGWERWHDERLFGLARVRLAGPALPAVADAWWAVLRPLLGRQRKALVLDLDGTLWGGVVGEQGPDGIALGPEPPGRAWRELQRVALALHDRGVLLAVASKNNPEDALAVLDHHPEMLLRREHFAALRIGWDDKAASLRAIAAELGIGLDQLVFLDDHPAERAWVRSQLPEVRVPELPPDPVHYASLLRGLRDFDALTLTAEDTTRTAMLRAEAGRRSLREQAVGLEDFYRSLAMRVDVEPASEATLPRLAQLTQRTNQFNLTGRRYDEAQLRQLSAAAGSRIYALRLRDRFGESGVVGAAIARCEGETWTLESFLLSCRVLGRTVEDACLAALADEARCAGAHTLVGVLIPTQKNAPARGLYPRLGFVPEPGGAEKEERWRLDLADGGPARPAWIELRIHGEAG